MRIARSLLLTLGVISLAGAALTIRTPGRRARWLADHELTKRYLATAAANFDWKVAHDSLDLVALDRSTREAIASSWTSLGAAIAERRFVWTFHDGHTLARVRPAIWWRGVLGAEARALPEPAPPSATDTSAPPPASATPVLTPDLDAGAACGRAGLDVKARPDGWTLPFPAAAGATLLDDPEFPAALVPLADGRRVGILRVANFGHEHFGTGCARAWEGLRRTLPEPCLEGCQWELVAATMRALALHAAERARALQDSGAVAVVVDITGNGGGSELADAMARALTATPLHLAPGGMIRHPLHRADLEERRAAIARDLGRATPAQRPYLVAAGAQVDSLLEELARPCARDDLWTGAAPSCSNVIVAAPAVDYLRPHTLAGLQDAWAVWGPAWVDMDEGLYRGPLLVLQDHSSASASEEFAARLRDNEAARIVGERSYGAGCGYSNGGTRLELTALGLLVRAPDCQRLRRDGRNEVEGIAADVPAGWTADDPAELRVQKALAAIGEALAAR
jgi:hypothetical protein